MNVRQFRGALEDAAAILAAAGATKQHKEILAFIEIFDGHDDADVSEFLSELSRRLTLPQTVAGKLPKQPDELTIERYVQRLQDAGTDKARFDGIYSDLKKDKMVRKEEMNVIAHKYTQGRSEWPRKSDALKEIKARFGERAYQSTKMVQVDKASRF